MDVDHAGVAARPAMSCMARVARASIRLSSVTRRQFKQYDGRPVEALGLPRDVLEKFYHRNARRLIAFR